MLSKFIAAGLLASLCLLAGCSKKPRPPQQREVVQPWDEFAKATEDICISDGSSLYIFHPNGDFELEPLGLSGRTIQGKWRLHYTMVQVTGLWSWMNGISADDDYRTMVLNVGGIDPEFTELTSMSSGKVHKVRKAYLTIESLEKVKK
jgi:hypothetical protein